MLRRAGRDEMAVRYHFFVMLVNASRFRARAEESILLFSPVVCRVEQAGGAP